MEDLCARLGDQQLFDVHENLDNLLSDIDSMQTCIVYNVPLPYEAEMRVRAQMYKLHVYQPDHLAAILNKAIQSTTHEFLIFFYVWCTAIKSLLDEMP